MAPVTEADPTRPTAAAPDPDAARRHWRANLRLTVVLLAAWFGVAFMIPWEARDLGVPFFGWPFGFWVAAQGGTCVFVLLIVVYAVRMRRLDRALAARRADAAAREVREAPAGPGADASRHAR